VNDNELERIRKEGAAALFNVLCRHLAEGSETNHEKPQDIRSPGRGLNTGPPEYKAGLKF
jgi:hypothetical protein